MAVIIDEFEVVLDSQQGSDAENSNNQEQDTSSGSSLKPHDISSIIEQQEMRNERVRAH